MNNTLVIFLPPLPSLVICTSVVNLAVSLGLTSIWDWGGRGFGPSAVLQPTGAWRPGRPGLCGCPWGIVRGN